MTRLMTQQAKSSSLLQKTIKAERCRLKLPSESEEIVAVSDSSPERYLLNRFERDDGP